MELHTLVDGKYFLQSLLAKREQVYTYQVWHSKWEMPLIAKVSRKLSSDLHKEAQVWLDLGVHPNIIAACFIREIEGHLWLFLEAVPGDTLAHIKKQLIDKDLAEVLAIALEIANGMQYLHSEGVVHGNLYPANIIMGKDGSVRIMNIRLAGWHGLKMLSRRVASPIYSDYDTQMRDNLRKIAVVKLAYLSPEHFFDINRQPKIPSDIYSFGVLLCELFSITPPVWFPEEKLEKLFLVYSKAHSSGQPPTITERWRKLPKDLRELILSCVNHDPQKRPQSFTHILSALMEIYRQVSEQPYVLPSYNDNMLKAIALNNRALGYIDSHDWERATKLLTKVVSLDTSQVAAPLNLCLLRLRNKQLSLADFFAAVEQYKVLDYRQALLLQAKVCLEHGSLLFDVLPELERVSTADDDDLLMVRADFHYRLGNYEKAQELLHLCSEPKKQFQNFWYRQGASSLARKLYSEARTAWEKGLDCKMPCLDLLVAYSMLLSIQGDWTQARSNLEETLANPYHYLPPSYPASPWSQVEKLMLSKTSSVIEVAFSRNQRYISAWSEDGNCATWEWPFGNKVKNLSTNLAPGNTARILNKTIKGSVDGVAVSSGGIVGITTHGTNEIHLWNMQKRELICELKGHDDLVTAIDITTDGQLAISASQDGTIRVWDIEKNTYVNSLTCHDYTNCIAISQDGRFAASGGWNKKIYIWDLQNRQQYAVFDTQGDVTSLDLNNHQLLIGGDTAGTVQIIDISKNRVLTHLQGHEHGVTAVAISENENLAISGGMDGYVCIYENIAQRPCPCWSEAAYLFEKLPPALPLAKRREVQIQKDTIRNLLAQKNIVDAIEQYRQIPPIDTDYPKLGQSIFATAYREGFRPRQLLASDMHATFINKTPIISFCPLSASSLFLLSQRGNLQQWHYLRGSIDNFWQTSVRPLIAMDYQDARQQCFCFAGKDKQIYLWYPEFDQWVTLEGYPSPWQCIEMDTSATYAVSGSNDGVVQLWNFRQKLPIADWKAHSAMVTDIWFDLEQSKVITCSLDGSLRQWQISDNKIQRIGQNGQNNIAAPRLCMVVSKQQGSVFSGSLNGAIHQYQLEDGHWVNTIEAHHTAVTTLNLQADGTIAISGDADGIVKLWNVAGGNCLGTIDAHKNSITHTMLSDDSRFLFTAAMDNTIKLWLLQWDWQKI